MPGSTLDRRKLATSLLGAGEARGRDASGMGWVSPEGDGYYKKDVPGGRLYTGKLPSNATAMILHTRQATHGSPEVNENNHPVLSPSGNIQLVHNGVVYNHADIRSLLGKEGKSLPEVDSSVIPALIEIYGLDSSSELAGYAAAAWFDRETDDTIHLARFKQSPVHYATLWDGSLAFASTPEILGRALTKAGVGWYGNYPTHFDSLDEGEYLQLLNGEFIVESTVEWNDRYTYSGYDWRGVTSGKESAYKPGTSTPHPAATPKSSNVTYLGGGSNSVNVPSEDKIDVKTTAAELFRAPTASFEEPRPFTDEEFAEWARSEGEVPFALDDEIDDDDQDFLRVNVGSSDSLKPIFYTVGHDGDYVTFTSLSGMVQSLSWVSGVGSGENMLVGPEEGKLRWVNHVGDIGTLSDDGSDQLSWVANAGHMDMYRSITPEWVRDGVSKLRTLVGS